MKFWRTETTLYHVNAERCDELGRPDLDAGWFFQSLLTEWHSPVFATRAEAMAYAEAKRVEVTAERCKYHQAPYTAIPANNCR